MVFKIGFASTYPPTHCGVGEYTHMLVTALKSLNPSLEIFIFADKLGGSERFDELAKVRVYPSFSHGEESYRELLDKLALVNGVDILHIEHEYGIFGRHNGIIEAVEEARKERLVRRVVITMHTVDHPYTLRTGTLEFQRQLNKFDAIIVHSALQEFELIHQGIDPVRIHRIPHGTLLNPYLWLPRYKLAESIGLREEHLVGFIIGVPGFLRKDKGLDILVKAVKPLLSDGNYTVIVAGEIKDPVLKKEVEYMISNGPNMVFIDRWLSNEEILKLVALVDAVILPYRDRPASYSVSGILHLSMGGLKPIIGTRAPRLIELYQHAPRMTVPVRSAEELTRKIKWLRENYDVAIAYMSSLYSYAVRTQWPRIARRHLSLYMNLLKEGITR
jgi:glycosyltransferase involved in cell wall biosynthesis